MTIKIKKLSYSEDLMEKYPKTNFITEYKDAFIGITEDQRSVYDIILLRKILEKKHIPEGFLPDLEIEQEIHCCCMDEIDFLENLWNEMYQHNSPILSKNTLYSYSIIPKIKEGKWFELDLIIS